MLGVVVEEVGGTVWRSAGRWKVDGTIVHHSTVAVAFAAAGAGFCVEKYCADCVALEIALRR